jgi:hypothetical protein
MRTMAAAKTPRHMFYFCSEMRLLASVMDDSGTLTSYSLRLAAPERKLAGAKVASQSAAETDSRKCPSKNGKGGLFSRVCKPRTNAHRTVVVLEGSVQWGCINPIRPCQAAPCQQSQAKPLGGRRQIRLSRAQLPTPVTRGVRAVFYTVNASTTYDTQNTPLSNQSRVV